MTSKIEAGDRKARGRPKGFDRDAAVRAAMDLFWERGYEGSTFDDLAAAMGINASSFRNTFKSKELLYREATDAYVSEAGSWFDGVLAGEKDVHMAFRRLVEEAAERYTREGLPLGCMVSLAATHSPPSMLSLKQMMSSHRNSAERAMMQRLRQGQEDGQIADDINVEAMAAFFNTTFRGMAVQARDGASTARLLEIADIAMGAFPALRHK